MALTVPIENETKEEKSMKKTLAFLLALVMMLAAVSAMAAAPIVTPHELPKEVYIDAPEAIFDIEFAGDEYSYRVEKVTEAGNVPVYADNESSEVVLNETGLNGDVSVIWDYFYDGDYTLYDGGNLHQLIVETAQGIEQVFEFYVNYLNKYEFDYITENSIMEDEETGELTEEITAPDPIWYPDNTMGLVGLPLRDTFPGLTSKWYHVVPVDLTVEGTTTIPMVASNLFLISNAHVTVEGDNVTVTYDGLSPHGYGWVNDECVAWFTSVDEITTEWIANPESDLEFGQTISRANDLGNAEIALLFVCNHVTYRQPYFTNDAYLPRYWHNLEQWKAYRADLTALLDQMTIVASPAAEAVAE